MKNLFIALSIIWCVNLPAQVINLDATTTRAVVIGISDYQDEKIPDLRFADRDAEAFYAWLKSPAGGNVPEENIQLLTNKKATNAAIGLALFNLIDGCKADDRAIIYFSGHGDVETKTIYQNGYLLSWDTPSSVYISGAVSLRDLQEVVSTLSKGNKASVLVITDACHAGNLAGSIIGGTQATAQELSLQFAKESKILSCQPNEFSIEGEQWGGGRGVFSYFLLKGLTGLADKNGDEAVSLLEIGRYLQDAVPAETAPEPQMPFTVGNLQTAIAQVDAPSLDSLRKKEEAQIDFLKEINPKGLEDDLLAKADSATRKQYAAFKTALATGDLLEPADRNAWDLFQKLSANKQVEPLHRLMLRNLATALLDEVQQALNALLESDPSEANQWNWNPGKYRQYPAYLQRAMELLGEQHYMYRSLLPKKLYFEALNLAKNMGEMVDFPEKRDSLRAAAKAKLLEAIRLEPSAAYLYHAVGNLYFYSYPPQTDSLLRWTSKAIEYSPKWLLPYLDISYEYQMTQSDVPRADQWLQNAFAIQPDAYVVLERLSWMRQWQGRTEEALALCDTMIRLKPDLFNAYATKGVTHWVRTDWAEAERYFKKALSLEKSGGNWSHAFLINLYVRTRRVDEAIARCQEILHDSTTVVFFKGHTLLQLAHGLILAEKYKEAEPWILMDIELSSGVHLGAGYYLLGVVKVQEGKLDEAWQFLQKAAELNPNEVAMLIGVNTNLALIEAKRGNPEKADSLFVKGLAMSSGNALDEASFRPQAHALYADFLLRQKRFAEARMQYDACLKWEPHGWRAYYGYALLAAQDGNKTAALNWLEKSLDNFYPDAESIQAEPLFKKIRKTKRFKEMMNRNFPDQFKD